MNRLTLSVIISFNTTLLFWQNMIQVTNQYKIKQTSIETSQRKYSQTAHTYIWLQQLFLRIVSQQQKPFMSSENEFKFYTHIRNTTPIHYKIQTNPMNSAPTRYNALSNILQELGIFIFIIPPILLQSFKYCDQMHNEILIQTLQSAIPCLKVILAAPLTLLTTVSAGLFQDTVRFCNLNHTLPHSLLVIGIFNLLLINHTIKQRVQHKTFLCDFVFSLGVSVSFIIGSIYAINGDRSILEETVFKIMLTFLLAKIIDAFCFRFKNPIQGRCPICLEDLGKKVIILKCQHILHEECMWKWMQTKKVCPICITSL